jgi:hypothetical protein
MILPSKTVVHIKSTGPTKLHGYGLEVEPNGTDPVQHWILFSDHPPAKYPGDRTVLAPLTSWEVTTDAGWKGVKEVADFKALACRATKPFQYALGRLRTKLAEQPDVGGFELRRAIGNVLVGKGRSKFSKEEGYTEIWCLKDGFQFEAGFAFREGLKIAEPGQQTNPDDPDVITLGNDPDFPKKISLDLEYFENKVPQ